MNWNWIHKRWLVARIELHWACISWCKRRGNHLLEHGKPLNSKRMLRLARKIDRHGMIAFRPQDEYEKSYVRFS